MAEGKVFCEGELTNVWMFLGDGHIQQLSFASHFSVSQLSVYINSNADQKEKIVSPLRKWWKVHVESTKEASSMNAVLNHCIPKQ